MKGEDVGCLPRMGDCLCSDVLAPGSGPSPASCVTEVLNLYRHASFLDAAADVYVNHIPCVLTDIGCFHCF